MAGNQTQAIVGPITVVAQVTTQDTAAAAAAARRAMIDRTPLDFLGCGLLIPFRRGSRDFVNGCEIELVKSGVAQALGTRAAHGDFVGDLQWRPNFGNKLWILRHRRKDETLRGQAIAFVLEALQHEPRARVTSVEIEESDPNELRIRVRYQIILENVVDNRVILPEYEEIVRIAA